MSSSSAPAAATARRMIVCGLVLLAWSGCRTTPQRADTGAAASESAGPALRRRPVELIPLVVTSPVLSSEALQVLREALTQKLQETGVFVLTEPRETSGELVLKPVIAEVGALPATSPPVAAIEGPKHRGRWSLQMRVEVSRKDNGHLLGVVSADVSPWSPAYQLTGAEVERAFPDVTLRHGLFRALEHVTGQLCARFGPGVVLEDPSELPVDTLEAQARQAYAQGDADRAVTALRALLERDPQDADAASLLADLYYNQRQYVAAVEHYNHAIDIEATRYRDLVFLGNATYRLLDYDRAIRIWEQALRLDPKAELNPTLQRNIQKAKARAAKTSKGRGLKSPPGGASDFTGDDF